MPLSFKIIIAVNTAWNFFNRGRIMTKATIEYSTTKFTEKELFSTVDLAASHFPAEHPCRDIEYLRWLYLENPVGPATLALAKSSDCLVGMLALIPIRLLHGSQIQNAHFCVNVLSHPDFRGNNIFINLIKLTKDRLCSDNSWLLGHPNKAAFPGWKRQKMDFRTRLKPTYLFPKWPFSNHKIKIITSFNELKYQPWEKWNQYRDSYDSVRLSYSAEFIDWRYLRSHKYKYFVHVVQNRVGESVGLFVSRPFKLGAQLIIDWVGSFDSAIGSLLTPRFAMLPEIGCIEISNQPPGWCLPTTRSIPFFASTWGLTVQDQSFCNLTLGASDM